jgi:hypothetical protein
MNRTAIALLAVAVGAAVTLHVYFGVSLGLALLIFFVGWPVLGTLITIDDDSKGGWSNPDGTVRPPWLQAPFWGQIIVGFALSSCGAAIDYGWNTQTGGIFWAVGILGFVLAVPMIRKAFRKHAG